MKDYKKLPRTAYARKVFEMYYGGIITKEEAVEQLNKKRATIDLGPMPANFFFDD